MLFVWLPKGKFYENEKNKILQCYGYKDSKPNEDILNYVNKIWLPYANRKIKKVA